MSEPQANIPGDCRTLGEGSREGIFRLDAEGVLVFADRRSAEILGYGAPEEMLGRHFGAFMVEEDLPLAQQSMARRRLGEAGVNEYRLHRKDGRPLRLSVSSVPVMDAGGVFLGVTGFLRDIGELRRIEAINEHKLRLLRRIAGDAPLRAVLDDLCLTLESLASRPLRCAIMIVDDNADMLACLAAPSMHAAFRARAPYTIREGSSTCARAILAGRPVIVADTLNDGSTEAVLALRRDFDYAAVWSYPILQDGAPLGTLAFLPMAPGVPDARDESLIEFGVEVARLALAHERRENALRESERRFHDFAELAADWFWEQDADLRFTHLVSGNDCITSGILFPQAETIGKQRWELPYVDVPEGFWDEHRRLLAQHRPFKDVHLKRLNPDGTIHHALISGKPIFDESGQFSGYRGVGRDITEQVVAQEKLEETQRRLEQTVRAGNIGLWQRDIDTWAFSFSANWRSLFGYADDDLADTAEDFDRLVHPDDLARIHAAGRAYVANPQLQKYEIRFRIRHKDGAWRWVLSRGNVVTDAAGGQRCFMGCHVDITELKQTQEALQDSEARLRDYADLSADWFWEQDAEFRYTAMSGGVFSKGGFRTGDGIGKARWELPIRNVGEAEWAAHRAVLERHEPFRDFSYCLLASDGALHWYSVSGKPVFGQDGAFLGYRGTARDITEQMAAREQLEKTKRWLEQAVRAAHIGLWERDPNTWDFRFTSNWKTLFGYAEDEIGNTGEDFDRLIHPDDLERIHAAARAYAANPQGDYENRFRTRHKDGSWRWVLSRGNIVANPAMGLHTWMGCHIDITAQVHAELALRESETLLRKVLELLPVGVWIMDAGGNIVQSNEAGRRIWAGARHVGIEQFGEYKGWWPSTGKRIAPEEWAAARAIMKGETSLEEEIEIECFDGTRKIILNSAMPLRDELGAITGGIIVNQDITARWQAERKVRELNAGLEERVRSRTAELEEANRELDAFNYSVSHDLRTPLRAIHGFSQALLEDHATQLDADGKEYLARICGSAHRMGELIDAIYHLSKLSRSLLNIRPIDLSEKARALIEELRQAEPARAVEAIVAPELAEEGDPGLLGILLSNLLANAWKYTARTPQARIEFGSEPGEDGRKVYYVRDNGAGFDMQFAGKLFKLFQRLHREEDFGGQGTGLVTAQRIVQRHGGRIWGEAEKGRGAVFRFTLWEDHALRREAETELRQRMA